MHFVNYTSIPQQGRSLRSFLFFVLSRSDKILTYLKTGLWNPGTYRHKTVRLSNAQFGFVMIFIFLTVFRKNFSSKRR